MTYIENAVTSQRDKVIVRTSLIGIAANIILAGFKAFVGLAAGSIAVVLDAVNNLSDALSSVITIVGTKLASKKPDKKHPYGYGRIEYISAAIISAIVLYAGITSFVESVKKIIHPETADYTTVTLIILAASVVVKLVLGNYVKHIGEKVNSGSLVASGEDARNDAVLSLSVLGSALVYMFAHISLEAYVGLVIAVMIIKSGIELLTDTVDDILGKRIDVDLSRELKQTISEDPLALGAYDLFLNSYGPDNLQGSVHVEVNDTVNADQIDAMSRRIQQNVLKKHGVILTAIGIYSVNTTNDEIAELRTNVTRIVTSHDEVLQIHGFRANTDPKHMTFDIVIDYAADRMAVLHDIQAEIADHYPEWDTSIVLDDDISD